VRGIFRSCSGGIAAINPRLISLIPSGCRAAALRAAARSQRITRRIYRETWLQTKLLRVTDVSDPALGRRWLDSRRIGDRSSGSGAQGRTKFGEFSPIEWRWARRVPEHPELVESRLCVEYQSQHVFNWSSDCSSKTSCCGWSSTQPRSGELLPDGALILSGIKAPSAQFELNEEIRIPKEQPRRLLRRWRANSVPEFFLEFSSRIPQALASNEKSAERRIHHESNAGRLEISHGDDRLTARCLPEPSTAKINALLSYPLPPARKAKLPPSSVVDVSSTSRPDESDELLLRPGYRAIRYPMPKTTDHERRFRQRARPASAATQSSISAMSLAEPMVLRNWIRLGFSSKTSH
jgi:hypothetical protein